MSPVQAPMAVPTPGPSGLFKAGAILLLVGAILQVVGAVFMVAFGVFFLVLVAVVEPEGQPSAMPLVMGVVYLVFGILLAVGSVFGFLAHRHAQRGEAHAAWVKGLVASLLPPLQVVSLLGAVFCLVSPEGEAAKRAAGLATGHGATLTPARP